MNKKALLTIVVVLAVLLPSFYFYGSSLIVVEGKKGVMGTTGRVIIVIPRWDKQRAIQGITLAFGEIERVSAILSRFDSQSPISKLNENGALEKSDLGEEWDELAWILNRSKYFWEITDGSFDVTVLPLLDLYRGGEPTEEEISDALGHVGSSGILVEAGRIAIKPGMGITLDGIAKGYGVDKAVEVLGREGFHDYLVDIGGDMRCSGLLKGEGWEIWIKNPFYPLGDRAYRTISMSDLSIATSGQYYQRHIIDPRDGTVVDTKIKSVTIVGGSCVDCDALATGIFVAGCEGLDLIDGIDGYECYIIAENSTHYSNGFNELLNPIQSSGKT